MKLSPTQSLIRTLLVSRVTGCPIIPQASCQDELRYQRYMGRGCIAPLDARLAYRAYIDAVNLVRVAR
jgi:hypothetical protein